MWELIRANKRRSVVLAFLMLLLLLALGFAIGAPFGMPEIHPEATGGDIAIAFLQSPGGLVGMAVAFGIWLLQATIAYFMGGRLLLAVSGAREIQKEDHPQLFNIVEEMTIASRLPKMPKVYIIEDMALNAFATGRDPDHAAVAVTAGLLRRLNRDQLQGVVAHEIAHIVHRDVLFMTMIGIMLGTIVMVSEVVLRSLRYSMLGAGRYRGGRGGGKNNGAAVVVVMVFALVLAILAPILAQLIYFAVSRKREYLADAGAAVYTRYPEGLAQALEAISGDSQILARANRATAPMYIINPLMKAQGTMRSLFSTHPPTLERINVLRSITGGVSYAKYQAAWRKGHKGGLIPQTALQQDEECPVRQAEAREENKRKQARETGDMLRNLHHFIFLACACGMRVKVPPEYKKPSVGCPRCKRSLQVAQAELAKADAAGRILGGAAGGVAGMAAAGAAGVAGLGQMGQQGGAAPPPIPKAKARTRPRPGMDGADQPPLTVHRKGTGWESFKCSCGAVKNIAPSYTEATTACTRCGRTMIIENATG